MDEQTTQQKPPKKTINPWLLIIFGCVALFVAVQLDGFGSPAYLLGKYVAKLMGYALFLAVPTFGIAKLAKKSMTSALRIFAWLFLTACLFDFVPFFVKLSYSSSIQSPSSNNISSEDSVLIDLESALAQSRRSTAEEIIAYWDPKLSFEQRKYRLWMDSLSMFISSLAEQPALDNALSLDRNLDKLRDAQDRIRIHLKNHLPIWEKYGPELESTIKDQSRLSRFQKIWRSFIEGVSIVHTYDSEAIGHIISYLRFLRTNRSKYYFVDGEMQSDDDEFIQQLVVKLSKLDNTEAEAAQQQRRNQAILDYAKALDIAKGKE